MTGQRVLLITDTASHLSELWRVALLLRDSQRFSPLVYFTEAFPGIDTAANRCLEQSIDFHAPAPSADIAAESGGEDQDDNPRHKTQEFLTAANTLLRRWIVANSLSIPLLTIRWKKHLLRERNKCSRVIRDSRAALLILAEDIVEKTSPVWIDAGHELGIRSVIVPYTIAKATEAANSYFSRRQHSVRRVGNRLLARSRSKWGFHFRGKTLVRLPAYQALAMDQLGLSPPNPWVLHSGFSDAIAVESQRMMEHYLDEGLPANQLVLTGSLAEDRVVSAMRRSAIIRQDLCIRYGLDPGRPLIVCALPPSQFGALASPIEFGDYSELVTAWAALLGEVRNTNVLIRPHPRDEADASRLVDLLKGLPITMMDTAELVAACDIYVASVSATIRWAITARKPALNYDVYQFGYDDYEGAAGVLTVRSIGDFRTALFRILEDDGFRAQLEAAQAQEANLWAVGDGQCGQRLLDLFETLSREPQPRKADV